MVYKASRGFTILELMIAITVFAVAMLLTLTGVIMIAKQYQTASSRVAIEEATRNIHQQISQSIQFSNSNIKYGSGLGFNTLCVGQDMYYFGDQAKADSTFDYVLNESEYNLQTSGLYYKKDNSGTCTLSSNDGINLLPPDAKVVFIYVSSSQIQTIISKVPPGSADLIEFSSPGPLDTKCKTNVMGREYCASVYMSNPFIVGRLIQ